MRKFIISLLWRIVSAFIGVQGLHTYASHRYFAIMLIAASCVLYRHAFDGLEHPQP